MLCLYDILARGTEDCEACSNCMEPYSVSIWRHMLFQEEQAHNRQTTQMLECIKSQ